MGLIALLIQIDDVVRHIAKRYLQVFLAVSKKTFGILYIWRECESP